MEMSRWTVTAKELAKGRDRRRGDALSSLNRQMMLHAGVCDMEASRISRARSWPRQLLRRRTCRSLPVRRSVQGQPEAGEWRRLMLRCARKDRSHRAGGRLHPRVYDRRPPCLAWAACIAAPHPRPILSRTLRRPHPRRYCRSQARSRLGSLPTLQALRSSHQQKGLHAGIVRLLRKYHPSPVSDEAGSGPRRKQMIRSSRISLRYCYRSRSPLSSASL